jgi:hypothetical protein
MDVTISIRPELEPTIVQAANRNGQDIASFVESLVEKAVLALSLDDILAPVRAQFAASGMTEEEFDALIEEERQANWEEKQRKKA